MRCGSNLGAATTHQPVYDLLLLRFVHRAPTAIADFDAFGVAIHLNLKLVDVWLPIAIGTILGVAHVMPKRTFFIADFTNSHDKVSQK